MLTSKTADPPTPEGVTRTSGWSTPLLPVERYLVPLVLLLLFIWVAFNTAATVERILSYYTPLPYWDYWRVASNLASYHARDLRAFWRQHNDHRIVLPEIVFALDMLVLHGRLILPLAVSFLSYVSTWLFLSFQLSLDRAVSRSVAVAATLLAGVIALWEGSAALLGAPFQLQWTLLQLAVACALIFLGKLKETSKTIYLVGVIVAAVVANYSSGNGLLLWPLLLLLGFCLRLNRHHLFILTVASATFMGLYFVDYQFGSDLKLSNLLLHPFYLLGYFGSYLSMPFGGINSPEFGYRIGLANLLITLFLFYVAARRGLLRSRTSVVLFGYYAFTLLTILMTAAGRMEPGEFTFGAAKPPRYITVPLMNWAVFVLLCFWVSARARFRTFSPRVLTCVFSFLLLLYLPKLRDWLASVSEDYSQQQLGALSIENNIIDPNLIRKIFIAAEFVVNALPELREEHLSIYYKGRDRWLGKPVIQFSHPLDTFIPGQAAHAYPVRGGVEIVGWADGSALHRAYTWIVLANERGQIIGFGQRLAAGFPTTLRFDDVPPSVAWVGFANLATPSQSISAYVVDPRRGGLYRIAGTIPVPPAQAASLEEAAGPVPGVTWQKDLTWTENMLPPRVPFGDVPPGIAYGSWSGNDSYTGQLVSSVFLKPANSCIILPVLHGPKSAGLSVTLIDAGTGQSIGIAPVQDGDTRWQYWRILLPASAGRLQIAARDAGKDWGEWLATANPLLCR